MAQLVGIWRGVCLLWLLAGASVAAADEVVLVSPDYWCPFSCKAGDAQEGFTVDIIREIFFGAGHTIRLVNENYSRALLDVRSGRFTATPSTFRDEAPDFVFPEVPISRNRYCFYVGPFSGWRFTGPDSLQGRHTGLIRDYSYGAELDPLVRSQPDAFESLSGDNLTQRMVQLVLAGRLDGFVEEENLVSYTLARHPEWKLRTAGCLSASYAYMALSPANPKAQAYARLFSEGMIRLRKSGRLKAILANYGLQVWPLPVTKGP
jgi:polar amino acid transport system substrate-binding protein